MLEDENRNMEDVAKDNFQELINRSLIQIGKINWGRVATCRVHDLLRELAIEKARELNFLYIYGQRKHSTGNSSIISSCRNLEIDSLTKLQSLKYVFSQSWISINTKKLGNLRELRIYGLGGTTKELQFNSIAKLERLEQLASLQPLTSCSNLIDLRLNGKIEKLPGDIHNVLPNLKRLSLKYSFLEEDPMPLLEKLHSLMILHLGFNFYSGKNLFCSGFRRLEILKLDFQDELEECQVEEGAMPRLRGLSIPKDSSLRILERFRSLPPPS
ncbi:hypothetical protein LWI29_027742 [Acer saccharum]|uniref:Uncharacterized protein n=1 Tax=Acer saccharum TaxID=4024 RepID=A0AA39T3P7_ACESA|nr:hypothetical protein LWI29_027742 [Acer saccharum]